MTITVDREADLLASVRTGLLIDGQWRPASGGKTLDVHDPATGKVLASIADGTSDDALAALDAASAAQAGWTRTAPRVRGEILRRAFELVSARAEDFALLMTLEMGKPLGRVSLLAQPDQDSVEGDARSVGDGELVVACGDAAPLLEDVEGLLDDRTAFVGVAVEFHGAAAACAFASAVGDLISGFGNDGLDLPGPQE
jgi:hypothetical protein